MGLVVGPWLGSERALDLRGRGDRVPCARETRGRHRRLPSRPRRRRARAPPRERARACAHGPGRNARRAGQEARRALDVGEEQRDRSGRASMRCGCRHSRPSLGAEMPRRTLPGRVRHPLRQAAGDPRRARPRRAPRRGGDLEGDARDPSRSARGGRQPRGRARLHQRRQGARARTGRPQEPDSRPAGREDRPRGAHRRSWARATRASPSAGRRP